MLNEQTKLPSPAGVVTEGCIPTRNSQCAQGARCRITASSWTGLYRAVLPLQGPSVLRGRCCRNIPFQISPRQGAWWHWGTWLAWLSVPGWLQHPPSKIVDVVVSTGQSLSASPGHSGMGGFSETTLTKTYCFSAQLEWEVHQTHFSMAEMPSDRQRGFLGTTIWSPANWTSLQQLTHLENSRTV